MMMVVIRWGFGDSTAQRSNAPFIGSRGVDKGVKGIEGTTIICAYQNLILPATQFKPNLLRFI
jgi:hypothetical protein